MQEVIKKETVAIHEEDPDLVEFKASVVRSMKQYNAGLVETFDTVEELLDDLHASD